MAEKGKRVGKIKNHLKIRIYAANEAEGAVFRYFCENFREKDGV